MPSTFTPNLNLELQATGDHSGTWGAVLNAGDFAVVDNAMGGVQTISLSSTDVTLTTSQTQVNLIVLTGALTANVNVIFPAIGRTFQILNNATGAYTVTLKISGAGLTTFAVPGVMQTYVLDGTNVFLSGVAAMTGTLFDFAGPVAPYGYLLCYGQQISRTTYALLFAVIGTTWGVGNGSTTFNVPDLRGAVVAGVDNMGGTSANRLTSATIVGGAALAHAGGEQVHVLTIGEMPSHNHGYQMATINTVGLAGGGNAINSPFISSSATLSSGGGGAHNNVQPTFIVNKIIKT